MEDFQQGAVPILHDFVMCGKILIDELPEVVSDRLASRPVGDAEITYGVLREAIEASPATTPEVRFS